jgi:DNA polymerase/3'-5' exonuclease PolX
VELMSRGIALRWAEAHHAAVGLVAHLADACERIEIAGSIRRRKGEVHDIELVAITRHDVRGGLWGDAQSIDLLGERVRALWEAGVLRLRDVEIRRADGSTETGRRDGEAYKALEYAGVPVDLFITDADRWGCIFALRTGPGDWNTRLVTEVRAHFRRVEGGRVLHLGRPVPTPEEADFFREVGQAWLDPWERRVDRVRIDPSLWRAA